MKLSVCTCVDNPITKEFYLKELIDSVWDIADEIVIVNGDKEINGEVFDLTLPYGNKIKTYHNPWESRLGKNMLVLQKNIAISHCTSDYILRLDADEVIHEDDHEKILKCMEMGHDIYNFRVLHFWGDYNHIKIGDNPSDPGQVWYTRKVYLFKNNLGLIEGNDKFGDDMVTFNSETAFPYSKNTSIRSFHYGHVRSNKAYLDKKNRIERLYHPNDWEDLSEWEFDMNNTYKYEETHPKVMEERIRNFNEQN